MTHYIKYECLYIIKILVILTPARKKQTKVIILCTYRNICLALKRAFLFYCIDGKTVERRDLRTLPTDPARQLNIFGHDRDAFSVNGAQVRVFE